MNKHTPGAVLSIFLCATGLALGQAHRLIPSKTALKSTDPSSGPVLVPPAYDARILNWKHLTDAARAAMRTSDFAEAEEYCRQALNQHVGEDLSWKILVEALHAQGEDSEALPFYQAISKEGEVSPGCELPYALLLLKTGQWAQAVAVYNRTLPFLSDGELLRAHSDFSPNIPRTKDLTTAIHIGIGIQDIGWCDWSGRIRNDEAILNLQQALALAPNSALANYQYGVGLARVGRGAEARVAFKKATAFGASDVSVKSVAQKALASAK